MANSILKLKVESSEYDQKLANAAKGIRHLADVAHKSAGELTGLEKSEVDYIKALGDMETKSRTASGQVRELSSTYKELKVIYDQLNEVEKADEGGKALAASLETLKQRAQEAKAQLDTATQSLNDNGKAGQGTSGILEVLKDKFTINIDAVKLFNMGLQAAETALNVAKDAFFNNEEQLDEWGRVVESSHSLYTGFLNALNTGDISGYLSNISQIVQAARDAYDAMDELATYNAFNQRNVQRARTGMTESIVDFREGTGSKEDVKAAAEAYKKELRDRQKKEYETYYKKIGELALTRGVDEEGLRSVLEGTYDDYKKRKGIQPTGERPAIIGAGAYARLGTETFAQNKLEKMAEALRNLNDTELQSIQAIGAQADRTGEEIAQVDKQLTRVLNGRQRSRGGTAKTTNAEEVTYASDSIVAQQKLVQDLTKKWNEAGAEVRSQYVQPLVEAEAKLKEMKDEQALLKEQAQGRLNGVNLWQGDIDDIAGGPDKRPQFAGGIPEIGKGLETLPQHLSPLQEMNYELSRMKELLEYAPDTQAYQDALHKIADKEKEISQFKGESNMSDEAKDSEKAWQKTASAISQVGSALKMIEDPTAQVASIIAEAIANIALTFSKSLKGTVTPWDWIAAAAAGTATMISTIAAIKQVAVGSYAQGGVIPGNSFSGDNQWARVNAGETILTQAQTGILASQLENAGIQNLRLEAYVTGEQIRLVLNNNGRRTGKGEYLQFKG